MQQRAQHFIHEHAPTLAPLFVSFAQSESKQAPSSSALIGSTQEFTLFQKLVERFPFAVVDQTNTRAKSMDLRVELPMDGEPCVIAIESKFYRTSNVPSSEIEKFERDYASMDVHGAILIAKRRVDVRQGYSQVVGHNLRRASQSTYYVDNDDFDALTQAIMRIYARTYTRSQSALPDMASLNEAWKHIAAYVKELSNVIAAVRGPLKAFYNTQNVLAAPVVQALANVRESFDGSCVEQVVHALQLRGCGSVKRKRTTSIN